MIPMSLAFTRKRLDDYLGILATSHPAVQSWLGRVAAIPGWRAPYDLLPGKRLRKYV